MANLENCQVTSFTSQEYGGDSFLNDTMTAQVVSETALDETVYKLFINSNVNYQVQSSYLTINETEPDYMNFTSGFPYGIRYWFNSGIENVSQIWMGDLGTPGDPNNTVEVRVIMNDNFVMPSSNYTVNVDIDGDAEFIQLPNSSDYNINVSLTKMNVAGGVEIRVNSTTLTNQFDQTGAWPCAGVLNTECNANTPCSPVFQDTNYTYTAGEFVAQTNEPGVTDLNDQSVYDNLVTNDCTTYGFSVDSNNGSDVIPLNVGNDIPSSLTWKLRATDGGSLQAISTAINVYYSLTHYEDANGDVQLIPYTSSNNLSAVDLSNVTLTQIDCESVFVIIPFNTDFDWPIHIDGTETGKVYIKNLFTVFAGLPAGEDDDCQLGGGDVGFGEG